jgi:hypothetical protein
MSLKEVVENGFVIRCQGGETLTVSATQAECILEKSEYFANVFRHGTKESLDRILIKPDWCIEKARCLVELLQKGKTQAASLVEGKMLAEAAEQLLIPMN